MEIKIGVQHTAREVSLESSDSHDAIAKKITTALDKGGLLSLEDDKGRLVIVPVEKIAYVEIGAGTSRRVGFGATD